MVYAQLFAISEEGNHYPQTARIPINPILEDLLQIPEDTGYEPKDCYWRYTRESEREAALSGSWNPTHNNGNF